MGRMCGVAAGYRSGRAGPSGRVRCARAVTASHHQLILVVVTRKPGHVRRRKRRAARSPRPRVPKVTTSRPAPAPRASAKICL
ncbi:hypothetical protein EVAR_57363_1 [Eumeta japonica]|uniref:Uncharacterized protein n=1 Tax=Eumeta variegata TaxID=151549 RepID=A0A4C1ZFP8_EUMVA|nr:hypothetical protein EVAR_57363_1 [Eumeta japonica]